MNWRSWRNGYYVSLVADTQGHRSSLADGRSGAEQEGPLHLDSITRLPLLCASKRLKCEQTRKAPRTGEDSDFSRLF
jgi:hypothetical protein